ncbi:PREDICTED: reverse mRNAase [Prunus dulcis]|uniref:PREDICTED: reverse mRNAase n=1 Tax=Prunus dulcis TaxID=3755 RepID=A0A5E4FLU8_PRUDU|nr:hypothetical protein L3X38_036757 [Prunus dulcis]VVA28875.1 PREDICTED: reverse mRNAase [Prunus dulcis]
MIQRISPNQVNFVPRRYITDNILIAQELMHKFRTSKGKKGFIAWKVDLFKAYGRLNWHFIKNMLEKVPLAWDPPRNGDFKLNVDGMRKIVTSDIGVGGVIRNSIGEWIDFAVVVTLIMNPETAGTHPLAGLLYGRWDLMKKISTCAIQHVY